MNQGALAGNNADNTFNPSDYLVGYWSPTRELFGLPNPAERANSATNEAIGFFAENLGIVTVANAGNNQQEIDAGWTTVCPQLPFDAEAFELFPQGQWSSAAISVVIGFDVAYGPPGKEIIVLEKFLPTARLNGQFNPGGREVMGPFPVRIPAGSRVALRYIAYTNNNYLVTHTTVSVQMNFHRRYPRPGNKAVTIPLGHPTLAPRLASAGGADTDTSFADVGTVPFDTHWVVPSICVGSNLNTYGTADAVFDWAYVDPGGSDVVFLDNIKLEGNSAEWGWVQNRPYPVNLPSGTLIRCRGKYNNTGYATFMIGALTCIGTEYVATPRSPGQSTLVG